MIKQDGLEWRGDLLGLVPAWTKEPDVDVLRSIARKHLGLDKEHCCRIEFLAQGAFNKIYKIGADDTTALLRVTLPVDPHNKTMSESATIEFVRRKTNIPVPRILALEPLNDNDLGFEWILMQLMPGQPLRKTWRKLPMHVKESLVKQLACFQAQLFLERFEGIGNIFETSSETKQPKHDLASLPTEQSAKEVAEMKNLNFSLGQIVSHIFFYGDHITQDVPRGPFRNSHDWLQARLQLLSADQERILSSSSDEGEIEDAENAKQIIQRLHNTVPHIFPPKQQLEPTSLFHDDLSMQNILVDEAGGLTAVIDWECVSSYPLWRACQIPALLEGRQRDDEPRRKMYGEPEEESSDDDDIDNEGMNSLYWEHLLEFEQSHLRRVFLAEIDNLQPAWTEEYKSSTMKAEFDLAVHCADNGLCTRRIREWLDAYESGKDLWSLRERLMG